MNKLLLSLSILLCTCAFGANLHYSTIKKETGNGSTLLVIGGIHGDNRSVIRHGRPAQQHQNQEERYKPFHLFPSLFVKGRTEKGFPVLVIQAQCCLIADMRLG